MPQSGVSVAAAMRPRIPACSLRTPVVEIARRMQEEAVGHLVVASAGSDLVAGVVSELDLLRAVLEGRFDAMASDVMTLEAPPTVRAGAPLDAAIERIRNEGIGLLVVVDGDPERPVGVLSATEVATFVARR